MRLALVFILLLWLVSWLVSMGFLRGVLSPSRLGDAVERIEEKLQFKGDRRGWMWFLGGWNC